MRFDVRQSIFAGVPQATLQTWLGQAQQAYQDLITGAKGEVYAYTQGAGAKSVTYTRANVANLEAYIRELQAALGMTRHARRAIGVRF
jgi:gpW